MLLENLHQETPFRVVFIGTMLALLMFPLAAQAQPPAGEPTRTTIPEPSKQSASRQRQPDSAAVREWDEANPMPLPRDYEVTQTGGEAPARNRQDDGQAAADAARGNSSSAVRKAALAGLPLDKLTPENRALANNVLDSVSYFRRLPTVAFDVDPAVYMYFVSHPDVAVSVWRAMKISKLEMWQTGHDSYEADAGDGTIGTLEVLYRSPEKNLVLCDGLFKSPLLSKPIKARSLLLLQTSFFKEPNGEVYATHRADLFVSFPSQTIEAVSKVLSPITATLTDRTFTEISLFLKMFSMAMVRRPDWVEQIVNKMEGIPDMRRQQVLTLTAKVYTTAQKQALADIGKAIDNVQVAPGAAPRTGTAAEPARSAATGEGARSPIGAVERDPVRR